MVSQTTTNNGINPTDTKKENKHWGITIQLARLINYLSSTIFTKIIPKRLIGQRLLFTTYIHTIHLQLVTRLFNPMWKI
jgi:hypothetical protein